MTKFTYDTEIVRGATFSRGIRYSTLLCQSTSPAAIAIGSVTFAVISGLSVSVGKRVRASLVNAPTDDPTQFVEGLVTAYNGSTLTINVDTYGGNAATVYSSWQLSVAVDLTGGVFLAVMKLSRDTCAGRARTPVNITVNVTGDPTLGIFTLYLTPSQTAALAIGDYQYNVLFTPASSSDKFEIVSGMISVIDD